MNSPAGLLTRAGELLARLPSPASATLLVGFLNPADGRLTWSSAGHPPPVHCEPSRPTAPLAGAVGPPLNTHGGTHPAEHHATLPPDAWLLLHTASLREDGTAGRLLTLTDSLAASGAPIGKLVDAVLGITASLPGSAAVLALHRQPSAGPMIDVEVDDLDARWTYPSEATTASKMRRDVRATLGTRGVDGDVLDDVLLAASEAVNNAVEHAQQPTRPEIEVQVRIAAGVVRITVRDFGSWRGRQPAMDRGRGAMLMNAYGDVRVVSTATGTTVIIERQLHPGATG